MKGIVPIAAACCLALSCADGSEQSAASIHGGGVIVRKADNSAIGNVKVGGAAFELTILEGGSQTADTTLTWSLAGSGGILTTRGASIFYVPPECPGTTTATVVARHHDVALGTTSTFATFDIDAPEGTVNISSTGLAADVPVNAIVRGPCGYQRKLTNDTSLTGLPAGEYTFEVRPSRVFGLIADVIYEPNTNPGISDVEVTHHLSGGDVVAGTLTIAADPANETLAAPDAVIHYDGVRPGTGWLWMAAYTEPALRAYTEDGTLKATIVNRVDLSYESLAPVFVAFDPEGNLWCANGGFGPDFSFLSKFTPAQIGTAAGTSVDLEPDLSIISAASNPAGPSFGGMAFDPTNGDLYYSFDGPGATPEAVLRYKRSTLAGKTGRMTTAVGDLPPDTMYRLAGLTNGAGIDGLAFDFDGNLWVADFDTFQLLEYKAADLAAYNGVDPVPASVTMNVPGIAGISFDKRGGAAVSNYNGGQIFYYLPATLAAGGPPDQTFDVGFNPENLAWDNSFNLWVADYDGGGVKAYAPSFLFGDTSPAQIYSFKDSLPTSWYAAAIDPPPMGTPADWE